MEILFITNYNSIAKASGGYISDYQNDLLFHGLYELYGVNVIDSTPIVSLYKEYESRIDKRSLWGGFTSFYLINKDLVDRTDIEQKIQNKYYDYVIYGAWRRCKDYYPLVTKHYSPTEIALIDGNDDILIDNPGNVYFKRELILNTLNIHPISFAIPEIKITKNINLNKIQDYATVIPGQPETYVFTNENSYYKDYQNSYFGVNMKKAGWDTMRIYETLGNGCLPYFTDIKNMPETAFPNIPRKYLTQSYELAHNFDETKYYALLNEVFKYTKNNLTTKHLAQRVINKLNEINNRNV